MLYYIGDEINSSDVWQDKVKYCDKIGNEKLSQGVNIRVVRSLGRYHTEIFFSGWPENLFEDLFAINPESRKLRIDKG